MWGSHCRPKTLEVKPECEDYSGGLRVVSEQPSAGKKTVLVPIENYAGYRLKFGLDVEKSLEFGLTVASVVVAKDIFFPGRSPENAVSGQSRGWLGTSRSARCPR
ncbi:hypothetical protein L218DRAFT_243721 [Marasmius fiardii PR-910]|nr:hypothetical protein L218DRAFT_243721 [Marasmius fiardii PR-910]